MLGEGDCVLGAIPKTGPLRYFCCEIDLTGRGRYFCSEMNLLKTGVLASLYRLEGALDAAGDCWNYGEWIAFTEVKAVSTESNSVSEWLCRWTVKAFTVYATVICPLGFDDCGNSNLSGNLLKAETVDTADTVQLSGWCWFWIVTGLLTSICIISRRISFIWI